MSTEARASNLVDSDKESGKVVYGAKDSIFRHSALPAVQDHADTMLRA